MTLSRSAMLAFLAKSYSSLNQNKLNGIRAELDFIRFVTSGGFADRASPGGWILRPTHVERFGLAAPIALFPVPVVTRDSTSAAVSTAAVRTAVHAVAVRLQDANIETYLCEPAAASSDPLKWTAQRVGLPTLPAPEPVGEVLARRFQRRERRYNFLRYKTDVSTLGGLTDDEVGRLFAAESLRVDVQTGFMAEVSDIDTLLWGATRMYPLEIKEKTRANDRNVGDWFGLDLGPFTKLAFYAAWYQRFSSLFVVREIDDVESRNLTQWLVVDFETIAKRASWVPQAGGPSMIGTASAVVKIPADAFTVLDADYLRTLR